MTREYLTTKEAAQILGCPRARVYRMIRDGLLPGYNFGPRMTRVRATDIERLASECRIETDPGDSASGGVEVGPTPQSREQEAADAALASMRLISRALKPLSTD